MARVRAVVSGVVQGVGFRWWVGRRCDQLGLDGGGENLPDGTVVVTASGGADGLRQLLADLRAGGSGRPGVVERLEAVWDDPPAAGR